VTLRVLVAPSGFKESLSAEEVAEQIRAGVRRALPDAAIRTAPLPDGGEGFARTLVGATGGTLHDVVVSGPVGEPVEAYFGFLGGAGERMAVLEMAAAAGLRHVPAGRRDPLRTTTYGVGELIRAALDAGAERLLVGCGDSGTNDAGAGMAQALGVRLLDGSGMELSRGGAALAGLARIDLAQREPRIGSVPIEVACNWRNLLCGPDGVARVFGPQKGASPEDVRRLEAGLERFAAVVLRDLGQDVRTVPGGGASGGLGAGLVALCGATLHPRWDVVHRYLDLDGLICDADLIITAEGGIDRGTARGKMPAELARRAKSLGVPVIALAGTIGPGAEANFAGGIASFATILEAPCTLDEAMRTAPELLSRASERAIRLVLVGGGLTA